jgi:hypothetical protein
MQIFCALIFSAKLCVLSGYFFHSPLKAFLAPDDPTLLQVAEKKISETDLFLKYQSHQGDYWVFYDLEGSTLLVRYRLDRWDYTNDRVRDSLRQGITYKLRVKNLRRLADGEIPPGVTSAGIPRAAMIRKIRKIRDLFSGEFMAVNESTLRDLRY